MSKKRKLFKTKVHALHDRLGGYDMERKTKRHIKVTTRNHASWRMTSRKKSKRRKGDSHRVNHRNYPPTESRCRKSIPSAARKGKAEENVASQ